MGTSTAVTRALAAGLAALLLAFAAGCGGEEEESNPRTLLDTASSKRIESADVAIATKADVPGFPILGDRLSLTARGPFAANGPDALPDLDWRVALRAGGQTFPARMSALDGRVYVDFMGIAYEADPRLLERLGLERDAATRGGASLEQLGVDPAGWLRDVEVSDGEEIGGDSTRLVTGRVDRRAVIDDLLSIVDIDRLRDASEGVEGLPELNDENVDEVVDAIGDVDVEVNVDDDGYPRRVFATLGFTVPEEVEESVIERGTVSFELRLDDIGEARVDVQPPTAPDDLSALFRFAGTIFGIDEPSDFWRAPN